MCCAFSFRGANTTTGNKNANSLKQGDWTADEERILIEKRAEIGAKVC